MLRLDIVSARLSWCWVLLSVITEICSLRLASCFLNSSWFFCIMASSSSTKSLNFPHCDAMVSCRSPQLGSPVHFFHCPSSAGFSTTGDVGTGTVGNAGSVGAEEVGTGSSLALPACRTCCCSSRSAAPPGACSSAWPRASRRAVRASGDIILSTLACTRASPNCRARPELVLQTLTGGGPGAPSCRNSPSLHLVSFRMKSKTAKSFLLMVRSAWFTPLVVWYSCVSFQSSSWVRWWARSICTMLSVAFTFFRSRSAICEPKRARSVVTCEKVSRFISVNSLHSITTASRSSQADSIMELRIFRAFWRESSLNSP
mmetsp:Transcript_132576/g.369615  ORF Transcript_132576/g.369615 Transcript_132576/m.369615 type:complete len:315 (-) Transcript_132576:529-1473(-)